MPKRLTPQGEAAPPVEPIITGASLPGKDAVKKPRARKTQANESGIMYVRNLHHIQCRVTLANGREIALQPRGQREDVDVVNLEEQRDPKFLANKDLLFEVIDPEKAAAIIYKQQTNRHEHPAWQHLRNAQGQAYEQRVAKVEEAFERQGITVGQISNAGSGRFTDNNVAISRADQRITSAPGGIGHPATELMQSVPGDIAPEEYREFLLWKQFREAQQRAEEHESPES